MVYLHVPFCRSWCTYCAFYSEICRSEKEFDDYAAAVLREIGLRKEEFSKDNNTLYIGGGTPSVLPLYCLGAIVGKIREALSMAEDETFTEFTVEVNPDDIVRQGAGYVRGLKALGVNRVSMGVQSFDDAILRWMNRRHDSASALEAFRLLREGGIDNISIDLIFGLSQLPDEVWEETIDRAIALRPEHISAYMLSVEEGSALYDKAEAGEYSEASDEQAEAQYNTLCRKLGEAGYGHYEISNFARPGLEARHNSAYWDHVPYVGLGPAAHSFDGNRRSWNPSNLELYLDGGKGGCEVLTEEQKVEETIMLALRTSGGIDRDYLIMNSDPEALGKALAKGDLVEEGSRLRIPESRFFLSDGIISDLI
ncbi:MAG: radical SAM family heme chaperone HemW [Bacteroidales bacterium]|nr:radical SAM family heme chaperone HemW [Bacteroidales bacterium]